MRSSWEDASPMPRLQVKKAERILDKKKKKPYLQARTKNNKFRQPVKKENILQRKVVVKIRKL